MARKNALRRNGTSLPPLSAKEKRQVEIVLIALAGGLGAVAGGTFAGGKGAAIGGAVGIAGALTLIYTQD